MPLREPILFPRMYWAYIVLAAMDVLLTALILKVGGHELNAVGRAAFAWAGLFGATMLKFTTVTVVLLACEYAERAKPDAGRLIVYAAVSISTVPVMMGLMEIGDAIRYGLLTI